MVSKAGIDYYPRDVFLMRDRKFNRVRQKFGYLTYVVYDCLLEMIYSDKGYFLPFDEKAKCEVIWDIQEFCRGKYNVDFETIENVIEMLVACELFSLDHFKQGIITSKRIQKVYYKTTAERKYIQIEKSYWLLSIDEMEGISTRSVILKEFKESLKEELKEKKNQPSLEENQPKEKEKQANLAPSKEEKRKEEEKREKESRESKEKEEKKESTEEKSKEAICEEISVFIRNEYLKCFGFVLYENSEDYKDILNFIEKGIDQELIAKAIKITKEKEVKKFSYTKAIIQNWIQNEIKDYADYLFLWKKIKKI